MRQPAVLLQFLGSTWAACVLVLKLLTCMLRQYVFLKLCLEGSSSILYVKKRWESRSGLTLLCNQPLCICIAGSCALQGGLYACHAALASLPGSYWPGGNDMCRACILHDSL